ncbi:hypothetical protein EZS27_010044 [termite gut metagenome]|uniref:Uncharacterized protein n=1 Tax=termite gut metagenome TaxID=433724 RepID=A0A5J4S9Z3_9ZZZZ
MDKHSPGYNGSIKVKNMEKETTRTDRMSVVKHRKSVDMKFDNFIFDKLALELALELEYHIKLFKKNNISDEEIEQVCPACLLICKLKRELEKARTGDIMGFTVTTTIREDNV